MEATHRLRYQESKEVKIMKAQLNSLKKVIDRGGATADQVSRKENIEQEIKDKRKKEYTLHQTLEREAYNMGKAHDRCTAEMFRPWKPNHSAQHIAALLKADWTDPSNPVMEGGVAKGEKEVLEELTKYYKALFQDKPTDPEDVRKCLKTLARGPQLEAYAAPDSTQKRCPDKEVESTMNNLPTGYTEPRTR